MLGRFFRRGKIWPGFFFPRGEIYTGILFPGAILSRGGFSGGEFYAEGNSMLQHRVSGDAGISPCIESPSQKKKTHTHENRARGRIPRPG